MRIFHYTFATDAVKSLTIEECNALLTSARPKVKLIEAAECVRFINEATNPDSVKGLAMLVLGNLNIRNTYTHLIEGECYVLTEVNVPVHVEKVAGMDSIRYDIS